MKEPTMNEDNKGQNMKRTKKITDREKELIKLIAEGWIDVEITEKLNISTSTVRNWLDKLYIKTDSFNRPQLIYWACKNGILN